MAEQPRLAGGARPRVALAAPNRVRVRLTPPDGGDPLSLWATVAGEVVTLDVAAPEVEAGWDVSARGFAGIVTAVDGRTLSVEVSP